MMLFSQSLLRKLYLVVGYLFLLSTTTSGVVGQDEDGGEVTTTTTTYTYYDCTFTEPVLLEGWGDPGYELYIEHYANYALNTITFRLTYNDWSWIGLGINLDNDHHMTNSYAVIGNINDGVQFYWLSSEEEDASGLWFLNDIHEQITNKSFEQTDDGFSIMEFTMTMAIADEDENATIYHNIGTNSHYIWGAGLPNNQWTGVHKTLGYFSGLQPYDGCIARVVEPVVEEDEGADDEGDDQGEDEGNDAKGDDQGKTNTATSSGNVSSDSNQSSISNASAANGASGASSMFVMGTTRTSDKTRTLWMTHGILMGLSWGVFVPLAIGSAYLKHSLAMLSQNGMWLNIHFYTTILAILCTSAGFVIAVVAANIENETTHFQKDVHHKAGLVIFILVFVQGMFGYFRPSPPKPAQNNGSGGKDDEKSEVVASSSAASSSSYHDQSDGEGEYGIDIQNKYVDKYIKENENTAGKDESDSDQKDNGQKTVVRQFWEYFHRCLGLVLLGLGWYNCTSGIELQATKYQEDDETQLLNIFWSITGIIAGCAIFIGYVIRPQN